MFKSALQSTPRQALARLSARATARPSTTRFLSTAPPTARSRGWKSSAVRWGAAAGLVYYYNTSNIFAEQPEAAISHLEQSVHHVQESKLPTLDAIAEERRLKREQVAAEELKEAKKIEGESPLAEEQAVDENFEGGADGIEGLEEEADQQGAFNPETGEINWDCPCLGGMAHGPCGEEFRAAFSCFVHSHEEPKGIECIENFKGMQDCFRQHPEMYGSELEDDEDEVEEEIRGQIAAKETEAPVESEISSPESSEPAEPKPKPVAETASSDIKEVK